MSSAILSNVYNHYLTTYAPKTTTQYDTHKKSELRNIYNSIVKLNKESPWYLESSSADTQEYVITLKENARLLHNTIASLGDPSSEEVLTKKIAYSSDEDIVAATFIGNVAENGPTPGLEIQVNSLATTQENMGAYLPDEEMKLAAGTYSFDVSIHDLNYEFQFNINEEDTNKDVQQRLVRLINNADIGIQARLDEGEARSSIRLTSETTGLGEGESLIFHISDDHTSKASGTVDYFGLGYISRQPANASFLLNGEERTTASNSFTVGKQFEVELKGVSDPESPITIGLKNDIESLADNISTLVGSFNSFVSAATPYTDSQNLNSRLMREMHGIASLYQTQMEDMGIHLTEDNTFSINDEQLRETLTEAGDSLSPEIFSGFAKSLVQKTAQISLNPMNYVNRTVVAYKNPGHNFATPYITSAYSGMIFNNYC